MSTDLGALARLFEINFAPSYHYQLPNPYGVRTGTEVNPIVQAPGVRSNVSFLSGLGGYLGQVVQTVPSILGAVLGGGGSARAIAPPQNGVGTISKVAQTGAPALTNPVVSTAMRGITTAATKHPILTAAGGAAATAGAVATLVHRRGASASAAARAAMGLPRRRRMHVTNVKALRRSLRRIHGFEKVCRKVLRFTSPGRHHGRATFKRPKRRG